VVAIGIALLASACWGVADFCAGLASRKLSALVVVVVQEAVGALIVVAIIVATAEGLPDGRTVLLSIAAGAAGAVGLGAFYRALAVGTMSIAAPISASGVTLPVLFGIATGDRPAALQAAGLVLAIGGVVLASREVRDEHAPAGARQSVMLALFAAVGLGAYFTLSDSAADGSILWLLLLARITAVLLIGAVVVARREAAAPPRSVLPTLVLVGVLDLAATGLYAIATTKGLLAVVAVVGALYPVATVLLARAVLHERLQRPQAAGVVLAFLGVAAVAGAS
jgi:drug/metabolite transporter (DMT)-like permease